MQEFILFIQAHSLLCLGLAALLVLLMILELLRLKNAAQQVSPLQLTQLINHQNAAVVDLRSSELFAKGHIIGALSLPTSEFKANHKKIEKMKARPIVLVCAKGQDSPKLADSLKQQGYQVRVLGGGFNSWINADLPIVKD